jgi:hypothetical protein
LGLESFPIVFSLVFGLIARTAAAVRALERRFDGRAWEILGTAPQSIRWRATHLDQARSDPDVQHQNL